MASLVRTGADGSRGVARLFCGFESVGRVGEDRRVFGDGNVEDAYLRLMVSAGEFVAQAARSARESGGVSQFGRDVHVSSACVEDVFLHSDCGRAVVGCGADVGGVDSGASSCCDNGGEETTGVQRLSGGGGAPSGCDVSDNSALGDEYGSGVPFDAHGVSGGGHRCGATADRVDFGEGPVGSGKESRVFDNAGLKRGKNYVSNKKKRERSKLALKTAVATQKEQTGLSASSQVCGVSSGVDIGDVVFSHKRVTTQEEQDEMAREWYERKRAENRLAIQKADYQFKRNEWLSKSRVSEKRWEEERLRCEEKLDALSKARLGHGPAGFAETVYSDGSVTPPSLSRGDSSPATLSDGTLSPDSSISVAELRRMEKKFAIQEEKIAELEMCLSSLKAITFSKLSSSSDVEQFDAALDGEAKEKVTYGVPNVNIMGSVVDGFSVDTDCF